MQRQIELIHFYHLGWMQMWLTLSKAVVIWENFKGLGVAFRSRLKCP